MPNAKLLCQTHAKVNAAKDNAILFPHKSDPMDAATDLTSEAEAPGVAAHDANALREVEAALGSMDRRLIAATHRDLPVGQQLAT